MAGIAGIGNNRIDWAAALANVGGANGIGGTEGAKEKDANLMVRENAETPSTQGNMPVPQIDVPENAGTEPAADLASLLAKLKDGDLKFTEEQLKDLANSIDTLVQKAQKSEETQEAKEAKEISRISAPKEGSTSKVLFDIYKMMALIAECAQELKNAQREQRQAETSAVVTSIQNQADQQRTAALTGLIAGGIVCAIQVGMTAYSAIRTVSEIRTESQLGTEMNVKSSATQLQQAETDLKASQTALNEFNEAHPVPGEGAEPEAADITQQRTDLQNRVNENKGALAEKRIHFEAARETMHSSERFNELRESQAKTKALFDLSQAIGNFGQTIVRGATDMMQADATAQGAKQKEAEEALEQTKDLMQSFQELIDQVGQLAQAVLVAENQSMRDAIQA